MKSRSILPILLSMRQCTCRMSCCRNCEMDHRRTENKSNCDIDDEQHHSAECDQRRILFLTNILYKPARKPKNADVLARLGSSVRFTPRTSRWHLCAMAKQETVLVVRKRHALPRPYHQQQTIVPSEILALFDMDTSEHKHSSMEPLFKMGIPEQDVKRWLHGRSRSLPIQILRLRQGASDRI